MPQENPAAQSTLLVVCLCAQWCGVCCDYREPFFQLQSQFPQAQFLWIDVEDEADLLDPLDVENFPTLLLARGDEPRFFGTLTPQPQTLQRLVQSLLEPGPGSPLSDPALVLALARIRAAKGV